MGGHNDECSILSETFYFADDANKRNLAAI